MESSIAPPFDAPLAPAGPVEHEPAQRALRAERSRLENAQFHLLATASQELRAPLMRLQGYSAMLAEMSQQRPGDTEQMACIVGRIAEGTYQLRRAVEETLEIAMIEARTLEILLRPVDLSKIICIILQDLRQEILNRGLVISLERMRQQPKVMGDQLRLYQALHHILGYAITQFVGERARITMRPWPENGAAQAPSAGQIQSFAELIISDSNGLLFGEPRAASAHASQLKTKLAIARGIIEMHGGRMWVVERDAAKPSQQLSFHVLLPLAPSQEKPLAPRAGEGGQATPQLRLKALDRLRSVAGQVKLFGLGAMRTIAQAQGPPLR